VHYGKGFPEHSKKLKKKLLTKIGFRLLLGKQFLETNPQPEKYPSFAPPPLHYP